MKDRFTSPPRMDASAYVPGEPLDSATLRELGIVPAVTQPPFDIIGDVHGCLDELRALLARLGYVRDEASGRYSHPQGRHLVFVGDLVDRGPASLPVLAIVRSMQEAGTALAVLGNHDLKFLRWLRGEHVRMAYGLALTANELVSLPEDERSVLHAQLTVFLSRLPGYLLLDSGQLVVTHGAILDTMIGRWDRTVASFCLYGEVEGVNGQGKPVRRDWGAERERRVAALASAPWIVYGHNVVSNARWVNRTLDLDTGCVYGGSLTALRFPEMEICSVTAQRAYFAR
jgi:protein phosphatase